MQHLQSVDWSVHYNAKGNTRTALHEKSGSVYSALSSPYAVQKKRGMRVEYQGQKQILDIYVHVKGVKTVKSAINSKV